MAGLRRVTRAAMVAVLTISLAGAAAACTSDGATGGSGSGTAADTASPGLTATTAKIGFIIVDIGEVADANGFTQADYGGVEAQKQQILAVVKAVNANNGLGGRQIEPVIRIYEGSGDSPELAEATCNGFTQDDQVFAVVMDGQFQNNVYGCYSQRKTLMIDTTLVALDQQSFENYAPYLWSPVFPEYGAFLKAQLTALQQNGYFNGASGVAVVGVDTEVARRQIDQTVLPFLAANGGLKSGTFYVDTSNIGSLGAGTSAALVGAGSQGLDRIIVVGGARILPIMLADVAASTTRATYAISSYDSPLFLQDNPSTIVTEALNGMVGFGFLPPGDVRDDPGVPWPDATNPSQTLCKNIIDSAQVTPPEGSRPNFKSALQYCDAVMFLKATMDLAGADVTPETFREAAWRTGTTYSSSATFGGSIASGQYAASNVGRVLAYEPTCQNPITQAPGCFLYRGGNVPFTSE
jgi:hypothetical protein